MAFDLTHKGAFITGGASGIGLAVAKVFIEQGARVAIADINDPSSIAAEIGAIGLQCDVSSESSVASALQSASESLGGSLDIVVLNAGIGEVGPTLEESDSSLIENVTAVNYYGVVFGLKHAPAFISDHGAIICTASLAAFVNVPGSAIYSASKKAVVSLTEMAALELGPRGIRVNCVCPGYVDTNMGSGDGGRQLCEAFTALGRMAGVDDISGVFLFLASEASRYVTGQAIKVDGGWSAGLSLQLLEQLTGSGTSPG
jgi:NAD(P)-dependent dehydrogenase (short-subunit alcohol dehydrogenase family)